MIMCAAYYEFIYLFVLLKFDIIISYKERVNMNTYHVTYFYSATDMEGSADTTDYGYVEATSSDEAKRIVGKRNYPKSDELTQLWGLSARLVGTGRKSAFVSL